MQQQVESLENQMRQMQVEQVWSPCSGLRANAAATCHRPQSLSQLAFVARMSTLHQINCRPSVLCDQIFHHAPETNKLLCGPTRRR